MKKIALISLLLSGALSVQADKYDYLNFESSNGTTQQLTATGLVIKFVDGNLVADNGSEQTTIALTSLNRMFFTKKDKIIGDVNGDNAVNVGDIMAIINTMATNTYDEDADVNGDKAVNVGDIMAVINIMAEK